MNNRLEARNINHDVYRSANLVGEEWYGVEMLGHPSDPSSVTTTMAGPWKCRQDAKDWAMEVYMADLKDWPE
jgi:hypothetical protein